MRKMRNETVGMVNRDFLDRMKRSAFLINISRGGLVIEEDLADFLNEERIAGAGLDVLAKEPPASDCKLFTAKNCFITPHISWATESSRKRLISIATNNLDAYLQGKSQNVVNN